ncbi:solute carrier family 23 protein [Desulfohalovibrio reitneri]|uniref:solute carrier family 23 protein n=1 Tax=Desulfohalovibrio reitneri TaxID=1307759 RepID=UPI0004A6AD1F|nr:solute carrier family 23 protein [Desulfohalovibrio reitneri]
MSETIAHAFAPVEKDGRPPSPPPGWGKATALGLQHVLLVFGTIALLPSLLGHAHDLSGAQVNLLFFATALGAALATGLQLLRGRSIGLGGLMFMATAGAFLPAAHDAIDLGGLPLLFSLGLAAAPLQAVYAMFLHRLRHVITPAVGGVVIMLAVTGLLKDSTIIWTGDMEVAGTEAALRLGVGGAALAAMLFSEWLGGRILRPWSLLFGLVVGTLLAWPAGLLDLAPVAKAAPMGLPSVGPGLDFGWNTAQHGALLVSFLTASLVTGVKYTGDAMALQKTAGNRLDHEAIQGGLVSASLGSAASSLLGGLPITSHSPNIPLVGMTRQHSRRVGIAGVALMAGLCFCPKFLAFMTCIPGPVIGAVGVVLVGHLFATGAMLAASHGLHFRSGLIVGLSLVMGLVVQSGLFFPNAFPESIQPLTGNGYAVGGLTAVLLSLIHHLLVERWTVIRLPARLEGTRRLAEHLERMARKYGLDQRSRNRLELACEEVYSHVVTHLREGGESGKRAVTLGLRPEPDHVQVEIAGRARVEDVEEIDRCEVSPGTEEDMHCLGLYMLHKIARDVHHIHISGYAFVSFKVPVD